MDVSYAREEGTTIQTIDYATKYAENQQRIEVISDSCGNPVLKKYNGAPLSTASYDVFGNPVQVVDKVKDSTYNYTYDRRGNVICVEETDATGSKAETEFTYMDGQLPDTKTYGATGHTYTVLYEEDDAGRRYPDNVAVGVTLNGKFTDKIERDSFGRSIRRTLKKANGSFLFDQKYVYGVHDAPVTATYTQYQNLVSCVNLDNISLQYTYDEAENIKTVSQGDTLLAEYFYDKLNRLVQEDNYRVNRTYIWNYDKGGNITSKAERVLSAEGTDTCIVTQTYTYRGDVWKDQLISYNGTSIVYDEMGNPTTYKNADLYWSYGRQLTRYGEHTFQYGADNIRYKKNNTVYTLDGSTILKETDGTKTITYYYGNGGVIGFCYKDATGTETDYFFEKNLQGDVIALCNSNGSRLVEYVYDAWGKILLMRDRDGNDISTKTSHIGYINPIRYRSYYYDVETNLYYLESRYYDPETGRFLNADSLSYLGDGSDLQNYNLYSYCENNPVMYCDPSGHSAVVLVAIGAIVGAVLGGAASVVSQGLTKGWESINPYQVLFDTLIGGISGAIGGSGISAFGSMISSAAIGFVGSVGGDLISRQGDWSKVNWLKAGVSGLVNGFIGLKVTGAGAGNWKAMKTSIESGKAWFSKAFNSFSTSVADRGASLLARHTAALYLANAVLGYQVKAIAYAGGSVFCSTLILGLWG